MGCEMCGKETELFLVSIENTRLNVCKDCSSFGKIIEKVVQEEVEKPVKIFKSNRKDLEFVVPDYSVRIRNARGKMDLSQKDFAQKLNERESIIHKLESGGIVPELSLAKKIERFCSIKLIDIEEFKIGSGVKAESGGLTVGDLLKKNQKL